jgi:hypothetical protein
MLCEVNSLPLSPQTGEYGGFADSQFSYSSNPPSKSSIRAFSRFRKTHMQDPKGEHVANPSRVAKMQHALCETYSVFF